jgi:hypothetical protein
MSHYSLNDCLVLHLGRRCIIEIPGTFLPSKNSTKHVVSEKIIFEIPLATIFSEVQFLNNTSHTFPVSRHPLSVVR